MKQSVQDLRDLIGGRDGAVEGLRLDPARRIVIGHRSHVWVGHVRTEGQTVVIEGAANVRRWGTTKGLGELADSGPTNKTVLDPCPTVRLHALAVIGTIDCREEAWRDR